MKKLFSLLLLFVLFANTGYSQENNELAEDNAVDKEIVDKNDMSDSEKEAEEVYVDTYKREYKKIQQMLKSEQWKERLKAVKSIPDKGMDDEDRINLIRIVLNDRKDDVRVEAVKALVQIGTFDTIIPLTEVLHNDKEYIRSAALSGLIEIGEEAAGSIGTALKDSSRDIRKSAVNALKVMERSIALKYLDIALGDSSDAIRQIAVDGIYDVYKSTSGGYNGSFIVRLLGKSINDAKRELRIKSIEYISSIMIPEAIEVLTKGWDSPDSQTRMKVAEAFEKIGGEQIVQPLARSLTDKEYDIRVKGLDVLSKIKTASALKVLASAIVDKDYKIRKQVIKILSVHGNETVVKEISKGLYDKYKDIRLFSAYTLGAIGNDESVDSLCKAIYDSDREVQKAALNALKVLKPKRSLYKVGKFLLSDRNLRKETAEVLGAIEDRRAMKYLLLVLSEEKEEARVAIESAIIKIISVCKEQNNK